jgi:hypothetical protein
VEEGVAEKEDEDEEEADEEDAPLKLEDDKPGVEEPAVGVEMMAEPAEILAKSISPFLRPEPLTLDAEGSVVFRPWSLNNKTAFSATEACWATPAATEDNASESLTSTR